jgi:hypothetical protein
MKHGTPVIVFLCSASFAVSGATPAKEDEKKPSLPVTVPAAILDIANSKEASLPGGSTAVSGKWSVAAGSKKLNVAPEPLLDSWLEFGPEIRGRGATIVASGRAPGEGRLPSRFGAGLYGKNGFQLRFAPARQEIELVRRGVVLVKKPFVIAPEDLCSLELSVRPERNHWFVAGRAWKGEEKRPGEAAFEYKIYTEELLFPLAGRSTLFATPFSGEAVSFASAKVFYGDFVSEGE